MFNSQRVNNDPQSWTCPVERHKGTRMSIREAVKCCGMATNLAGRTEYDNNPNPILESFREQSDWGNIDSLGKYENCAEWLWWLSDPTHSEYKWQKLEHIDHARKVLTRLVNVYGDS